AAQMWRERIEEIEIAPAEVRPAFPPPDAKVAEIAVAVEDEKIDTVVQAIARQKVVVELGAHQYLARNHVIDQRRAPACAQFERHRVAKLIPLLVAAQIAPLHVEAHGLVEAVLARIPDIGGAEIAAQQADHVEEDDRTGIRFGPEPFQPRNDIAEQT